MADAEVASEVERDRARQVRQARRPQGNMRPPRFDSGSEADSATDVSRRSTPNTKREAYRPVDQVASPPGASSPDDATQKPQLSRRERIGNRLENFIDRQDPAKRAKGRSESAAEKFAQNRNYGAGKTGALSGIGAGIDRGESGLRDIGGNAAGGAARSLASDQAAKRGWNQAKTAGVAAGAEALARGQGVGAAADKAAAAALQAKKIEQFRRLLLIIRGVSALSIVGIIITVVIWGLQLLRGHLLGNEAWKMSRLELILAVFVWIIISIAIGGYILTNLLLFSLLTGK